MERNVLVLFAVLFFSLEPVKCYSQNSYQYEHHKYCDDLSPYMGDIDLDQIRGVWYGVEKIEHTKGEYRIEYTRDCFYIDIKERHIEHTPPPPYGYGDQSMNFNSYNSPSYMLTTSPYPNQRYNEMMERMKPRIRHFILQFHDGTWIDEYHIKVNTSHKGFWPTNVPNGYVDHQYRFFGGVIQVLKAANNHMVLNFCMRLPHSQQFSVILSRQEKQMYPEEVAMIHNIFTAKNLSTSSLKRVCDNGASVNLPPAAIFVLVFCLVMRTWGH